MYVNRDVISDSNRHYQALFSKVCFALFLVRYLSSHFGTYQAAK